MSVIGWFDAMMGVCGLGLVVVLPLFRVGDFE